MVRCPNCESVSKPLLAECPQCGLVFKKWLALNPGQGIPGWEEAPVTPIAESHPNTQPNYGPQTPTNIKPPKTIDLSEIIAISQQPQTPSASPESATESEPISVSTSIPWTLFGWIAFVGVIVFGFWWAFMPPEGLPLPEGAYKNDSNGYALLAPAGWTEFTLQNYSSVVSQFGSRFEPEHVLKLSDGRDMVSFVKLSNLSETAHPPGTDINTVSNAHGVPSGTDSDSKKNEFGTYMTVTMRDEVPQWSNNQALEWVASDLAKNFVKYEKGNAEVFKVDNMKSVKVDVSGSVEIMASSSVWGMIRTYQAGSMGKYNRKTEDSENYETYEVHAMRVVVPAGDRSYWITCVSDKADFALMGGLFEKAIQSFRIMDRPSFLENVLGVLTTVPVQDMKFWLWFAAAVILVTFVFLWRAGYLF